MNLFRKIICFYVNIHIETRNMLMYKLERYDKRENSSRDFEL